jgi:hypothetical protein
MLCRAMRCIRREGLSVPKNSSPNCFSLWAASRAIRLQADRPFAAVEAIEVVGVGSGLLLNAELDSNVGGQDAGVEGHDSLVGWLHQGRFYPSQQLY